MSLKLPDNVDSKFRFILIAAERAKHLQNGAPPRMEVKSRKPAYVAIKETEADLVDFELTAETSEEE